MNQTLKGTLCGIGAAVSYGLNPLGALPMYDAGVNTNSVLFYRYVLAVAILAIMLGARRKSLAITLREAMVLAPLGVLFAMSSVTLFYSFRFMDAGVACTLLFVYPVMVAVIMALFFKERLTWITAGSIVLALTGIAMLYRGDGGMTLDTTGVLLVMASSLTYALYIVIVNKSHITMSSVKLTFWVLVFGISTIVAFSLTGDDARVQWLTTPAMWGCATVLAVFPTVVSLLLMVVAVHNVGSTPTAIMGALEPVTAVVIGITLFGEHLSLRMATGIALILAGVTLIVAGKRFSPKAVVSMVRKIAGRKR